MSWFSRYNRDEHLAKLERILNAEIKSLTRTFVDHVRSDWFSFAGDKLEWDVPMPYQGKLVIVFVSEFSTRYTLFLRKNSNGVCTFLRHEVINLANSLAKEVDAEVIPDFSMLPEGYNGDSFITALRRRPDLYGPHI